jgi:hypothetical protein
MALGSRKKTGKANELSIETDISEPIRMLTELGGKKTTVMRHILSGVGTVAKSPVKKGYKEAGLSKRSGLLYKSIERKVLRSGKAVIVQAKARSKNNVFYGYALAKGSLITAKKGEYLTFQANSKWVKVHSVKLPERDFVSSPVKAYLQSAAFRQKLDQLVEKEVIKIEKKAKGKAR